MPVAKVAVSPTPMVLGVVRALWMSMLPPDTASMMAKWVTVPHAAVAGPKVTGAEFEVLPPVGAAKVTACRA